jgi:hypothetical protein
MGWTVCTRAILLVGDPKRERGSTRFKQTWIATVDEPDLAPASELASGPPVGPSSSRFSWSLGATVVLGPSGNSDCTSERGM